jgi:hypothetical protein
MKPGNLNLLEPEGPMQNCTGIALPFTSAVSFLIWAMLHELLVQIFLKFFIASMYKFNEAITYSRHLYSLDGRRF